MCFREIPAALSLLMVCGVCSAAQVDQLGNLRDRIVDTRQDWGELGINVCAHTSGQTPLPLQIGDKKYAAGLGTHANGFVEVALDGDYEQFDAEVGLQPLAGEGRVIFQVLVDGTKQFDSGVLHGGEPAKGVSISLRRAQTLRLVCIAAGDGILYDCANWADARLTRAAGAPPDKTELHDIAPFARVMTSDSRRTDGARAGRAEEYHADDLYLEWPIDPASAEVSCIGLNWIEQRPIREIGIVFKSNAPSSTGAIAQTWVGPTAFQGKWTLLKGTIETANHEWRLKIDSQLTSQKVRWILTQSAKALGVDHLTAYTQTPLATADFDLEVAPGHPRPASITAYNGELLGQSASKLAVRFARRRRWKAEQTLLRFMMPDDEGFSVAINDVLGRGPVFVRDYGVFITAASNPITLADYQRQIADRKTILEEVRERPDQTLAVALARLHHGIQDQSPVMLSLACDNHKVIVDRSGNIAIPLHPTVPNDVVLSPPANVAYVGVKFGSGRNAALSRRLADGWLPAPLISVDENGARYRQQTLVIPTPRGPLAISDFTLNSSNQPATLGLSFPDAWLHVSPRGIVAESNGQLFALIESKDAQIEPSQHGAHISSAHGTARLLLPLWKAMPADIAGKYPDPLSDLRAYWEKTFAHSMQIDIPDKLLMNVVRASQIHCMMAARNQEDGKRIVPWTASISYGPLESESNSIIHGMDLFGHDGFARKSLEYFIHLYGPSGMLTTGYTLMGTGWHLETLGQHYALWHDHDWLQGVAPKVASACRWIDRQRQKSLEGPPGFRSEPPYGLAPPGVMADWGNYGLYFCLNGYFSAGLRDAAAALQDIGFPGAKSLLADSNAYAESIRHAYHEAQALAPVYPLRDGTWVPAYPTQAGLPGPTAEFFPGQDGDRSWCYDVELGAHQLVAQGILDPRSNQVDWMLNHMEDVQFLSSGWFDFPASENEKDPFDYGGFAKVQPYYCRNAEIDAMRDDVKPFLRSYFNALSTLLNTEVLSLEEHFHRVGAWNKTHETGYFLQQTRFMLVMEHGDALWLAPLVTNNWLKDGMKVAVKHAPTRFGEVSYQIASSPSQGISQATIDPPTRSRPREIVIRLRDPNGRKIRSVSVNGQPHRGFDPSNDTVTVDQPSGPLKIVASYE